MRFTRPVVAPVLSVALGLAALLVCQMVVYGLCDQVAVFAAGYNQVFLWLLTSFHHCEPWFMLLPVAGVVVAAPRLLHHGRRLDRAVLAVVGLAALLWGGAYLVLPYQLWRISPRPWISAFLVAGLCYLWLRWSWAYLPLTRGYRSPLQWYLRRSPRGEAYLDLLGALRGHAAVADRYLQGAARAAASVRPLASLLRLPCGPIRGFRPAAWLIRAISPRMARGPLSINDRILHRELLLLREETRAQMQAELYGSAQQDLRPLDPALVARLDALMDRWLAYGDALAECYTFDLLGPKPLPLGEAYRAALWNAARVHARAAFELLLPALRNAGATPRTSPAPFTWPRSVERALPFVVKALNCLEACAVDAAHPCRQLLRILAANLEQRVHHKGAPVLAPAVAGQLLALMAEAHRAGRELCGIPDAVAFDDELETTAEKAPFVELITVREWFCQVVLVLEPAVPDHARDVVKDLASLLPPGGGRWLREEQRYLGVAFWQKSVGLAALAQKTTLENAIQALQRARQCYLHGFGDLLPHSLLGTLQTARAKVPGPQWPATPRHGWAQLHGSPSHWLWPAREPNCFTRGTLAAAAVAVLVAAVPLLMVLRDGALRPAPDLRLGGQHLHTQVHSVSQGLEPEPALYVGASDGVHVKAGGDHHMWYHIIAAEGGLLSNDVLRVDVGRRLIAYLCANGSQRGVCTSRLPVAAPGVAPSLLIGGWSTLVGFSSFPGIEDAAVTTVTQTADMAIALFATAGRGLGCYVVDQRRWIVFDDKAGFIPRDTTIHDVAALQVGGRFCAYGATDQGLVWGPIASVVPDSRATVQASEWQRGVVPGLSEKLFQVRPVATDAGIAVAVRTTTAGVGRFDLGSGPVATTIVIGDRAVAGLVEERMQRVAHLPEQPLWFADVPGAPDQARISSYSEQRHEWKTMADAGTLGPCLELAADRGAIDQVLVGGPTAMTVVADNGAAVLASRSIPTPGAVHGIASAPGPHGIALYLQRGDVAGVMHLPRTAVGVAPTTEAPPLSPAIGLGRVPGMALDRLNAVLPAGEDRSMWLATRGLGVAYLDAGSREIRRLQRPQSASRSRQMDVALDLALVAREGKPSLLARVTGDHMLELLDLGENGEWHTVMGGSHATASLPLLGAAAIGTCLAVGSADATSVYDMQRHEWTNPGAVPGLQSLMGAAQQFWAVAKPDQSRRLYQLKQGRSGGVEWQDRFPEVRAFAPSSEVLAVVDKGGAVLACDAEGNRPLLVPKPLPASKLKPQCAATVGEGIYLAPAAGGIGYYHLAKHAWESIALPQGSGPIEAMWANDAGLWIQDTSKRVFLNRHRDAARSGLGGFEPKALVEHVTRVFAGVRDLLVQVEGGAVLLLAPVADVQDTKPQTVVGERFKGKLESVVAVAEFDGYRFFAQGPWLGRYDPKTGHFENFQPCGEKTAIVQLQATAGCLYVLDESARLFRVTSSREQPPVFRQVMPETKVDGMAALAVDPTKGAAVATALGVVAKTGVFVLVDGADRPAQIVTRTEGPPVAAELTCAAEVEGDLLLGTRAHGLWLYGARERGDRVRAWRPLLPADPVPVSRLVPSQARAEVVAVLGDVVVVLSRAEGAWTVAPPLAEGVFSVAEADGNLHLARRSGAVTLLERRREADAPAALIGAGTDSHAATRSVVVDPDTQELVRVAADGTVARYRPAEHRWTSESITKIRDVFVAGKRLWAWSPETNSLWLWGAGSWARYPGPNDTPRQDLAQVVWDETSVLLRTADGDLWLWQDGSVTLRLPAAARAADLDVQAITAVAEIAPWLVVGTKKGIRAYDRQRHAWKTIAATQVARFEAVLRVGKVQSIYVLDGQRGLSWLHADGGSVALTPVEFPEPEAIVDLIVDRDGCLVLTEPGRVHRVQDGKVTATLVRPVPCPVAVTRVHAALEASGHLWLAVTGTRDGKDASWALDYDPARLAWQAIQVPQGVPVRLLRIGSVERERLLLLADTSSGPRTLLGIKAGQCEVVRPALMDVTSDGEQVWIVDEQAQLARLVPGTNNWVPALASGEECGGTSIRKIIPHGSRLFVLCGDKTLWSYSLETLTWERCPEFANDKDKVESLRCIGTSGPLLAVVSPDARMFSYAAGVWREADDVVLPGKDEASLWVVAKDATCGWRANAQDKTVGVDLKQGRFAFNRYRQLQWHQGSLWLETEARHVSDLPVFRTVDVKNPESAVRVADHFRIDAALARTNLSKPSALKFEGEMFRGRFDPAGAWTVAAGAAGAQPHSKYQLALHAAKDWLELRMVGEGEARALAFDRWSRLARDGEHLVVASAAGILTLDLPQATRGVTRRALHAATDAAPGFARTKEGRLLVGLGQPDVTVLAQDPSTLSWTPAARERDAFLQAQGLLRYQSLVDSMVIGLGESNQLTWSLRLDAGRTVPVTLAREGFLFDQMLALGLGTTVEIFTADGRVLLPRTGSLEPQLGPSWRLTLSGPGMFRKDRTAAGEVVLIPEDPKAADALVRRQDQWERVAAHSVQFARGAIHFQGSGLVWATDDQVTWSMPPHQDKALRARFDPTSGQLSFDQVLAVGSDGSELWVASRAGVQIWIKGRWRGTQLNGDAERKLFEAATSAEFGIDLQGARHLELHTQERSHWFVRNSTAWALAPNQEQVAKAAAEARGWLVRGKTWRVEAAAWKPEKRTIGLATDASGSAFGPVKVTPAAGSTAQSAASELAIDVVNSICGSPTHLCLGTDAGLLRIEVARWDAFKFLPSARVKRVANDASGRIHVQTDDGTRDGRERLHDAGSLKEEAEAPRSFRIKDAVMIETPDTRATRPGAQPEDRGKDAGRQDQVRIEMRLDPNEGLVPVGARDGRFAWDSVNAHGLLADGGVLLATDHGFVQRRKPGEGTVRWVAELAPPGSEPEIFSRWDGERRVLHVASTNGGAVFKNNGKWEALPESEARVCLKEHGSEVARSRTWRVSRAPDGLSIQMSVSQRPEQPVQFLAGSGGFGFDQVNGIAWHGKELALATDGGMCWLGPGGELLRHDALDAPVPATVSDVARTRQGPIALIKDGRRRHFRDDVWQPVSQSDAQTLIDAQRAAVHTDPDGWTIERRGPGLATHVFAWRGEPVTLLPVDLDPGSARRSTGLRFAHDIVDTVAGDNGVLWLGTAGGVVTVRPTADCAGVVADTGRNLQAREFVAREQPAFRPYALRAAGSGGSRTMTMRSVGADRAGTSWTWDGATTAWQRATNGPAPVLAQADGMWTWTLESAGDLSVELHEPGFQLPTGPRPPLFADGTLSAWRPPCVRRAGASPLAFQDDWFVATVLGVLRLRADTREHVRLYGRTSADRPLHDLERLEVVDATLHAVAADARTVYRYDPAKDSWSVAAEEQAERVLRPEPVTGQFLRVPSDGGRLRLGLRQEILDVPAGGLAGQLLSGGRFGFDICRDLAVTPENAWCVTDLGVARLDARTGAMRLFRQPFGGADVLPKLRLHGRGSQPPVVLAVDGRAWRPAAEKRLEVHPDATAAHRAFAVAAANELFSCTRGFEPEITVRLTKGQFPDFVLGKSSPPLFARDLFGFDEVSDVRLTNSQHLMLATRLGVWRHDTDADGVRSAPAEGSYWATSGDAQQPMLDLESFVRDPEHEDRLLVTSAGGRSGFERALDGRWQVADAGIDARRRTVIDAVFGAITVQATEGGALMVTCGTRTHERRFELGAVGDLRSLVVTPTSLWVPLQNGMAWVVKDRL